MDLWTRRRPLPSTLISLASVMALGGTSLSTMEPFLLIQWAVCTVSRVIRLRTAGWRQVLLLPLPLLPQVRSLRPQRHLHPHRPDLRIRHGESRILSFVEQ